jgi:glycosyltransferase involved in cell wall biosynthesis
MTPHHPRRLGYLVKAFPRISETFILNEVLELERQGFDLRLYALNRPRDTKRHALADQVRSPLVYLPESLWLAAFRLFVDHLLLFLRFPRRYVRALAAVVAALDRDLAERFVQAAPIARLARRDGVAHLHAGFVHAPASVAWLVHRVTGMPYSVAAHAKDLYHSRPDILQKKLTEARVVFTCTQYNVANLQRFAEPGRIDRLRRVYHGADLDQFAFGPYGSDDPPLVLAVARLVEKKGLEHLIRACALLNDRGRTFRCAIIGEGDLRAPLERLRGELKLGAMVSFEGALDQQQVRAWYRRATLLVLPSIVARDGDRDGIPNVLVEASAMGVPVISTPTSGIPELVRHGETGLVVAPGDPAAIAAAVGRLLDDAPLREQLRAAARRFVEEHFDLHRNATTIGDELRRLLNHDGEPVERRSSSASWADDRREGSALPRPVLEEVSS